jgi:ADP-ribose pyrophosphatase YjhB (NUDIX family)
VRAAVFRDEKILLVKEKIDGRWSLPGGWADVNTSVSESAVRECIEEAGAVVKAKRIIAVQMANRQNNFIYPFTIYKIIIECELVDYCFKENTETLESGFFAAGNLPDLSLERNTPAQINLCFKAKNSQVFEAVFD